jgi:hypothetical protein
MGAIEDASTASAAWAAYPAPDAAEAYQLLDDRGPLDHDDAPAPAGVVKTAIPDGEPCCHDGEPGGALNVQLGLMVLPLPVPASRRPEAPAEGGLLSRIDDGVILASWRVASIPAGRGIAHGLHIHRN